MLFSVSSIQSAQCYYWASGSGCGMVFVKLLEAFFQITKLFSLNERGAGTYAFVAFASGDIQRDGADSVVQHFFEQLNTCETRIGIGKIKAIGNGLVFVFVIHNAKPIVSE